MKSAIINQQTASFYVDGQPVAIIPEECKKTTDGYCSVCNGLKVDLQMQTENQFFTVMLRLTNNSAHKSGQIQAVKSLAHTFILPGELYFESIAGDSCGADSFVPIKQKLDNIHLEPFGGRPSDRDAFPFFEVHNGATDYVFGIGWTGQWCADIKKTDTGFHVEIGITDCDFYLKPGESVRFPLVLIMQGKDPKTARQDFVALLRERFTPRPGGKPPVLPIAIQPFDRYFAGQCGSEKNIFWNTQAGQIREAEIASRCGGFDALWIDAAWMKVGFSDGIGNYSYAPGYPDGMKKIADRVHELGMRFVVWFEPERIVEGTETDREVPQYLLHLVPSKNRLLNLSDKNVSDYLCKKIGDLIEENGIDVYRQDFNMCPLGYWRAEDSPDRRGITELHYVENYYSYLDYLLNRFPNLMIDNCASGGRRLDLEMVRRSVTLWRSDTGCCPEHDGFPNTLWNNLQTLALSRYLPYTCCASWTADAYSVRSVFTGGIALNLDILNPSFRPESVQPILRECVRTRRYWSGKFIPITEPDLKTDRWAAYRLDCKTEGCILYFRKSDCENESFAKNIGEFEIDSEYDVTFTDEHMTVTSKRLTGKELSCLCVVIPERRASLLVEYKQILGGGK